MLLCECQIALCIIPSILMKTCCNFHFTWQQRWDPISRHWLMGSVRTVIRNAMFGAVTDVSILHKYKVWSFQMLLPPDWTQSSQIIFYRTFIKTIAWCLMIFFNILDDSYFKGFDAYELYGDCRFYVYKFLNWCCRHEMLDLTGKIMQIWDHWALGLEQNIWYKTHVQHAIIVALCNEPLVNL